MFKCPICEKETCIAEPVYGYYNDDGSSDDNLCYSGGCNICGDFIVSDDLIKIQIPNNQIKRYIVSSVTRNLSEDKKLEKRKSILFLRSCDDVNNSIKIPDNPIDKIELLLMYFYDNLTHLGSSIKFIPEKDYSICFAINESELLQYLRFLIDQGYCKTSVDEPIKMYGREEVLLDQDIFLTILGWEKAHELANLVRDSKQAFIAMHFSDQTEDLLSRGFYPAIDSCGYKPYSSIKDEHNESITDVIMANIRKSGLMIADLTGARQNVYYEAGFAKGLGIPVIFTCQEGAFEKDSHFDVDHIKHIKWKEAEDLKEKLKNRIEATGLSKI